MVAEARRAGAAPQLVCPAGSLRALQVAVDAGADAVYLGLKDATNARNFAGLNFDDAQLRTGIRYAHTRGRQVLMALNTYADAHDDSAWQRAVDRAAELGADALIVADVAVMAYARRQHLNCGCIFRCRPRPRPGKRSSSTASATASAARCCRAC